MKKATLISVFLLGACLFLAPSLYAQEKPAAAAVEKPSSGELIVKSWGSHGKRDVENTFKYTQELIDLYKDQALAQQKSLSSLPKGQDEINKVSFLNDVATAYFIQAESLMRQEKKEEAKKLFKIVIEQFSFGQAWDPRGWFWSIAEASRQSIKKMETGSNTLEPVKEPTPSQLSTKINLYDAGKEDFVDYEKYGEFTNAGTKEYKYVVKDQEGLSLAVGEGIYPNTSSVRWDPEFKKVMQEKRFEVKNLPPEEKGKEHWYMLQSPDLEAVFLKWCLAPEPQGVKMFYTAMVLEKAGLIKHAIKCYYAIVVHFPGSYGITWFKTPWYVGPAAISKINFLLRRHPELGYRLTGADIKIINGFDKEVANDIVLTTPGKFIKVNLLNKMKSKPDTSLLSIKKRRGKGTVRLVQYETGDWQLLVNDKPYVIKGITYAPTKVGESPDEGTMTNWMESDLNKNGKIDGPYDAFIDKNKNNLQDADEPAMGDFQLMKEMGTNTIRLYHHPMKVNKELLRDLYNNYGIMVIMGDFLGKYALGSGAPWNPGTDYENPEHRKNMIKSVTDMVNEYKDEPYLLFWLLGNENVYGYACNADIKPEAFYKFASDVAAEIKKIDPNHPVALCNGDVLFLDKFGKNAPEIDIFGSNAYRGDSGFGFLWRHVRDEADRPAFITEYGCSGIADGKNADEGEFLQAEYHRGSWEDIESNMAFADGGAGTALGAIAFEYVDEWWKGYEPSIHDVKGTWFGPFPDGRMHEEWLGLIGQGDGKLSPFLRQPRKAYFMYKSVWNKK